MLFSIGGGGNYLYLSECVAFHAATFVLRGVV